MQRDYPGWLKRIGERLAPTPVKPCGSCTMCCHIIPVAEIGLPAYTRCPHERAFPAARIGCAIYPTRPSSCRVWTCQWALNGWDDERRPDRCGVVVDPQLDLVRLRNNDTGESQERAALQIWAAPGFEEAYQEQPVLAIVLAALEAVGHVLWRFRGDDGTQMAMGIGQLPSGEIFKTAPAPVDWAWNAQMREGERVLRAEQLLKQRTGGKAT